MTAQRLKILACIVVCYAMPAYSFKVLCMVGTFPSLPETFILNQITGLIDRGHEVYIYASSKDKDALMQPQVAAYNLLERTFYRHLPKNFSVDIVICQFGPVYKTYNLLKAQYRLQTKKVVTLFRGCDINIIEPSNQYIRTKMNAECDLLLPVCDYFKALLIQSGCNEKKILVHHSSTDCSRFAFKPRTIKTDEPLHIVTTARLVEKKGIEYAIRAIGLVRNHYPNICYTIIGSGPLEKELLDLIKTLNLESVVHCVGQCTHEDVAHILDSAHLFVLPSITARDHDIEGIPNALQEAMAAGIPVIGTYHSGTPELITHGVSGFLVPEKNVPALARQIEYLIQNPQLWPIVGAAARAKIEEEFEIECENDRLEAIFNNLLLERKN